MANKNYYCSIVKKRVSIAGDFGKDSAADLEILCDFFSNSTCTQNNKRCEPYKRAIKELKYQARKYAQNLVKRIEYDIDTQSLTLGTAPQKKQHISHWKPRDAQSLAKSTLQKNLNNLNTIGGQDQEDPF